MPLEITTTRYKIGSPEQLEKQTQAIELVSGLFEYAAKKLRFYPTVDIYFIDDSGDGEVTVADFQIGLFKFKNYDIVSAFLNYLANDGEFTFSEYSENAAKTERQEDNSNLHLLNLTLGAAGEVGEMANKIKKQIFHNHKWNPESVLEEVSDCLWYLDRIANNLGSSLEEVAHYNNEKLADRYPNGFNEQDSINRKENNND